YCALRSGLMVEEHHYHRYAMTYTPMGTDAFIGNTENLVFTNTTSAPIRILAEASGSSIKITFMGTEDKEYLLDIESVVVLQKQPNTIYQTMSRNNVYGYLDGDVIQTGLEGFDVEIYLCKYDRKTGELVSRELMKSISYEVRDIIVVKIESAEGAA
ncbi:MAG: VanW family protein, partial [Oscillospiraceae bacterium]|nr:VanW family protein [Oscillospiraceae bacterium]